jgi:hypothetical protein
MVVAAIVAGNALLVGSHDRLTRLSKNSGFCGPRVLVNHCPLDPHGLTDAERKQRALIDLVPHRGYARATNAARRLTRVWTSIRSPTSMPSFRPRSWTTTPSCVRDEPIVARPHAVETPTHHIDQRHTADLGTATSNGRCGSQALRCHDGQPGSR